MAWGVAEGDTWWTEVGPVDLHAKIVTIQRQDQLIAALSRRSDGRLRIASFHSARPQATGRVHHRHDNWEYAQDCSALIPSRHSVDAGISYLTYWRPGLGQHPTNSWAGEPSFLVFGLTREAAGALGRRFGQNTILWSAADAAPRLVALR